ncbi:glycosyltransferase [Micromonospora sp. DR5-3]|uniref:glycosyltransferase n=1 Tax=unclassified Micromonospora TaxID=2617518 RepID=UPI0011DAB549|nr:MULTISPECIES: glycosyltransferase [unclassified Micromonospora]MCW3814980.1 glycosyltransferase [Micromonospora sp. DR5-3]TYC25306.1 glycosyltransferase family 4 protein [Micromonospora sp. MP36]
MSPSVGGAGVPRPSRQAPRPSRPPRLLVVAYHFPPAEAVGARRPAALARAAVAAGWEVRVLCAGGPDATVDGLAPADVVRVRSWRLPSGRLGGGAAAVGLPVSGSAWPPGRGRLAPARIAAPVRAVAREILHLPDPEAGWIVPAVRAGRALCHRWSPDVVVASGPPFSVLLVAALLARRLGVPWVADYRDLWTVGNEYWGHGRSRIRRFLDHRLERRMLHTVARCVTVSEPLARTLRETFGVPADVVMNGVDGRPRPTGPTTSLVAPDVDPSSLVLVHTGLLYPGRRDPTPLLRAVALLGDDRRRVRVVLAGPETAAAHEAAARCGVPDVVSVVGQVSAVDSWQLQAAADVLVLLMWDDPRDAGTVPGKLFDYLLARRPILMVGHPDGVAADLIRSRGAGVVLGDPVAIAARLRDWLALKERTGRIEALPENVMDGLFREDQMRGYLDLLATVAGRERAPATADVVARS